MTAHSIASKIRRALRNETSAHFTATEVKEMREMGALIWLDIYPSDYVAPPVLRPIAGEWPVGDVVYFIGPVDGPVKIGFTNNLHGRYRDLKYMSPSPIHVWTYVFGTFALEKQYHARFKACRLHGEWFDRTEELVAEIDRLSMAVDA